MQTTESPPTAGQKSEPGDAATSENSIDTPPAASSSPRRLRTLLPVAVNVGTQDQAWSTIKWIGLMVSLKDARRWLDPWADVEMWQVVFLLGLNGMLLRHLRISSERVGAYLLPISVKVAA
jgi:hypothetical protein